MTTPTPEPSTSGEPSRAEGYTDWYADNTTTKVEYTTDPSRFARDRLLRRLVNLEIGHGELVAVIEPVLTTHGVAAGFTDLDSTQKLHVQCTPDGSMTFHDEHGSQLSRTQAGQFLKARSTFTPHEVDDALLQIEMEFQFATPTHETIAYTFPDHTSTTRPEESNDNTAADQAPQKDAGSTDVTREKLEANWIETTISTRTLLSHGHTDEVRAFIDELDENLASMDDGGVPPGSDELEGVIYDAVSRAAIPYGTPPLSIEETTRQLRNAGLTIPDLDLATLATRTGITALTPEEFARPLDAPSAAQQSIENVTAAQDTTQTAEPGVTIYTTPDCPGCMATKRALDKAGVAYDAIDLSERPDLVQAFKAQGLRQSPIVEADGDRWTGYNPSKLREHGLDYRSRQGRGTDTTGGIER